MLIFLIIESIIEEHLTESRSAKTTVIDQNSVPFVTYEYVLQVRTSCNATCSVHATLPRILVEFDHPLQDSTRSHFVHIVSLSIYFISKIIFSKTIVLSV